MGIAAFLAGIFLFNAIPHMVQGICGKSHMTPFSPKSGPATNVVWGWINILIGLWLLKISNVGMWKFGGWFAFCIGGFAISLSLAIFWSNPEARLPWHKR